MWKKVKLLKMSNFTFFHNVLYAICILKPFNSHISVVVCSFFEFRMVSKWCIKTRGPRWPLVAYLNFWDDHSQIFFVAFREEFTRISICLYSASSPHLLMPCLLTDNPAKLFQNLTSGFRGQEFWRISLKSTHWKKPPPMAAIFFDGSNIREQLLKRVTQGTILWNYSKFWPAVSEKKIF